LGIWYPSRFLILLLLHHTFDLLPRRSENEAIGVNAMEMPTMNNNHLLISALSKDRPGIFHPITEFFSMQEIEIEELETATYTQMASGK